MKADEHLGSQHVLVEDWIPTLDSNACAVAALFNPDSGPDSFASETT